MKEYLLNTWGGFYNEEHTIKHGKKEGYFWFKAENARSAYIQELRDLEIDLQAFSLMIKCCEGESNIIRIRTIVKAEVSRFGIDLGTMAYDMGYAYDKDSALYYFRDGNMACDCNRSNIVAAMHNNFPELGCGDTIVFDNIRIEYSKPTENDYEHGHTGVVIEEVT